MIVERTYSLEFNRNSYTVNAQGNRVYFELSRVPVEGVRDFHPTGVYSIERSSVTVWVLTHIEYGFAAKDNRNTSQGLYDHTKDSKARRIGVFRKLEHAKNAAIFDYNKLRQEA